jgi:predicted transcriptional regulator
MDVVVSARLPSPLVKRLDEQASAQQRTRSALVAHLVAEALADDHDPAKEDG